MKIFEVNKYCERDYHSWIPGATLVTSIDAADLVLFKGGDDVDPSFYGEKRHPLTHCNTLRDKYEEQIWDAAIGMGKKILGVCRGSQFLSVMNGAKLHQHIEGHGSSHLCYTIDSEKNEGEIPLITSSHHQCLDLESVNGREDFELLGFGFAKDGRLVPEFFTFPNTLCIQSHPEYVCDGAKILPGYEEYISYCRTLLNTLMNA